MAIPFLFELRTLMDWIWTDTSMTLMDWLKMEDIFASVFLLKVFDVNYKYIKFTHLSKLLYFLCQVDQLFIFASVISIT